MKNVRAFMLLLFVLLLAIATACGGSSSQTDSSSGSSSNDSSTGSTSDSSNESEGTTGEQVVFKMGHFSGPDHAQHKFVMVPFSEEVLEATEGRVKFELYPGAALAPASEQWDSVVTGIQDAAWHVAGYTAGKFPLHSIINLPHLAKGTAEQVSEVAWKLYEEFPEIQAEYEEAKPLWIFGTDEYVIMTVNKEIKSFADVQGLKLRAPNPEGALMIESWGATPVSTPANELYDALQKGVVDGTVSPMAQLEDYNMYDVIKYVTHGHFSNSVMSQPMNKSSWEKISEEDKQILEEQFIGLPMSKRAGAAFDVVFNTAVEKGTEAGITFNHLPEEELAKFEEASKNVIENYIADLEGKGLPAQAVYDRAKELFDANVQ